VSLPQPQQPPVTNEVLAYQIGQVQDTLRQVLTELKGAASKEDVAAVRAENVANGVRIRVLEDDRTRVYTILSAGSLLGLGGLAALIRWAMMQ
jgi:hypothetical protein